MSRPPLTVALSSVLKAQVEGTSRAGLLAVLHPDFAGRIPRPRASNDNADGQVIPMPRVIPLPLAAAPGDDDPDTAA